MRTGIPCGRAGYSIALTAVALVLALPSRALAAGGQQGYFAGEASYHTGASTNSHIGQFSYGGLFQAETEGPTRYTFGVSARRGSFQMDVAATEYDVISLDLQVRLGILIDVFSRNMIHPFVAASGLGGANLLTSSSPPATASASQAAYGWGYEFEAGIAIRSHRGGGYRVSGIYRKYKFSYGGQSIASDAIAGRLGFVF